MTGTRGFVDDPAARDDDVEMSLLVAEHALLVEGNLRASRELFGVAYRKAESRDDAPGMARAAAGLGGLWVHEQRGAAEAATVKARQRHALALVDPRSPPGLRLRVRLAGEEDYRSGRHDRILALLAEARQAGDPVVMAEALSLAHHCVLGPDHVALRRELAEELIGVAAKTGRRGDLLMGLLWQTVDVFLAADRHSERYLGELRALLAEQDHLAVGFVVDAIEVMRGIRGGRFEEAAAQADACAERGAAAGDVDVTGWYGGQFAAIRWYEGRIAELVPLLSRLVASPTLSAVDNSYFAILAVAAATAGDRRLAVGALARIRGRGLAELPRSSSWLVSMYGVVEAACLLDDAELAAEAYDLLLPFAHLPVIASLGVACLGSVHHCLGLASLTAGDVDRAIEHLRAAVRDNQVLGHWPAVALSRARLAQALALRDGYDDEARRERDVAAREMAALGMAPPADVKPARRAGQTSAVVCRRRGRQWEIELAGRVAYVGHSVGMDHLAVLLANPGREIPAVELAAGPAVTVTVLDEQAKHAYKQRLETLRDEIAEFESRNEFERATGVRAERDRLLDDLAAATGMAGRAPQSKDDQQRARLAVSKAIRRALRRVAEADPVIGAELSATVETGMRCSYRPK